ncbi:hypothetical protein HF895_09385 [Bacteroides sp. AN502]|jgi:hypothetical protein|nr:hypothetical protein [Caecibacteroides pullorum]MDC6280855.1 hypothetical protein [Caecibacteroides pullorum]
MGRDACVVFSDELLAQFYQFKENGVYDEKLVQKLLHYYKPVYLTNLAQLKRIGHQPDRTLEIRLATTGLKEQTLEELAEKTCYKIILCTDRNDFPYVNINGDKIENNLSGTFLRSESRMKAIDHLKALCADVKKECIVYDKYFSNQKENVEVLKKILPKRKLTIRFEKGSFSALQQSELNACCPSWTLAEDILSDCHDRYLIIDGKMEIVLTSGFQYLTDERKEFTYLVRKVQIHPFI